MSVSDIQQSDSVMHIHFFFLPLSYLHFLFTIGMIWVLSLGLFFTQICELLFFFIEVQLLII